MSPKHRLRTEDRHLQLTARRDHTHADHVVLQCHEGVIGEHPNMAAVLHGDRADAGRLGLLDGKRHGAWANLDPEPAIGIERGAYGGVPENLDVGLRLELAGFEHAHIRTQHVGDAVTFAAA